MQKSILIGLCVAALALGSYASAAKAEQAEQDSAPTANMPEREKAFIDLLTDVKKEYSANHSVTAAQDARMGLQVRMMGFMRQSQLAQDWHGVVKSEGITSDGNARITIQIADGITISTWSTDTEDSGAGTLFKPGSPLFEAAKQAKIGAPIVFSGTIIKSLLASDEEMVMRPQFVARFSALKNSQ